MWQGTILTSTTQTDTDSTLYSLGDSTLRPALGGAYRRATFYVETTAIGAGDTWLVEVIWAPVDSARYDEVGSNGAIAAPGMAEITQQTPFTAANRAVPFPTHVRVANSTPGASPTITFKVHAVLAT